MPGNFTGQRTWAEVDFDELEREIREELGESLGNNEDDDGSHYENTESTPELPTIPDNLRHLFVQYPFDERPTLMTCKYCKFVIRTCYAETHVEECNRIPPIVKEENYFLTHGSKLKPDLSQMSSPSNQRSPLFSSSVKSSSNPLEATLDVLLRRDITKPSSFSGTRTFSSAPSSPSHSSLVSNPTINYNVPQIKIEDTDSPPSVNVKPHSAANSPIGMLKSKRKGPGDVHSSKKSRPTVVLKIKGNTSTTTTSTGSITLHVAPKSEPISPVPENDGVSTLHESFQTESPPNQTPSLIPLLPQIKIEVEPEDSLPTVILSAPLLSTNVISLKAEVNTPSVRSPSSNLKRKRGGTGEDLRKIIPLRERHFNPNEHCGVINSDGTQCKRSLTCKTHSMSMRRAVAGRSQPFDILIATQKQARDKARLAKQELSTPVLSPQTAVSLSPIIPSIASSVESSSDASKLSLPSTVIPVPVEQRRSSTVVSNASTLQTLLMNSSLTASEDPILLSPIPQKEVIRECIEAVKVEPFQQSEKRKPKPNLIKKGPELVDFVKLQDIPIEPLLFECITKIIPPEEEILENQEELALFENGPFINGRNILLIDNSGQQLKYVPIPLVPIPLGRRKHPNWRQSNSTSEQTSFRQAVDAKLRETKRMRRDSIVSLVLGDASWNTGDTLGDTITLTRGDEDEDGIVEAFSPSIGILPSQRSKVSFKLQTKRLCRPHANPGRGVKIYGSGDISVHLGSLFDVTNGPMSNGKTDILLETNHHVMSSTLDSMDLSSTLEVGSNEVIRQDDAMIPLVVYQANESGKWIVEQSRNHHVRGVDGPVADSELSELLAAQFEDY